MVAVLPGFVGLGEASAGVGIAFFHHVARSVDAGGSDGATVASDYFTSLHRVAALIPEISAKGVVYGGDTRQSRGDAQAVPLADLCEVLNRFESTGTQRGS